MFGLDVKLSDGTPQIIKASEKAAFRNLGHAAARITKDAKASITRDDSPSQPGDPPHTKGKGGHNLRSAIRYAATKDEAVIGPLESYVGESAAAHEFGTEYQGQDFPERPFMRPALEANLDRMADDWKHSLSE